MSWNNTIVYQIYPLSYQDSNNDGKGDIKGIIQRLDHIAELGIPAIWVGPLYKTLWADNGYDVIDHTAIDPVFGSMRDALDLIHQAHSRKIKILFDFIPNHTSDQHPWFIESKEGKRSLKRDWYVWKSASIDGTEPNNWIAVFGGSAWTFDSLSEQYYLHTFYQQQPDLNLSNPRVRKALYEIMKFWLDRGVDGFRVDAIAHIAKDLLFRNNPVNKSYDKKRDDPYDVQLHENDKFQPERFIYLNEMVQIISEYHDILLMSESYASVKRMEESMKHVDNLKHTPTNFELITLPWQAKSYLEHINQYLRTCIKYNGIPNWTLSNHDRQRVASRVGHDQARLLATLQFMLPGIACMYYGEEIGMTAPLIDEKKKKDRYGFIDRDAQRTPMQWDDTLHAGFSQATPWLPVNEKYSLCNVAQQRPDPESFFNLYKELIKLKLQHECCRYGSIEVSIVEQNVLKLIRRSDSNQLTVYCNFNDFNQPLAKLDLEVPILSSLMTKPEFHSRVLNLRPYEAVIISSGT